MSLGATIGCTTCNIVCSAVLDRGEVDDPFASLEALWTALEPIPLPGPPETQRMFAAFLDKHCGHGVVVCDEDGMYRSSPNTIAFIDKWDPVCLSPGESVMIGGLSPPFSSMVVEYAATPAQLAAAQRIATEYYPGRIVVDVKRPSSPLSAVLVFSDGREVSVNGLFASLIWNAVGPTEKDQT